MGDRQAEREVTIETSHDNAEVTSDPAGHRSEYASQLRTVLVSGTVVIIAWALASDGIMRPQPLCTVEPRRSKDRLDSANDSCRCGLVVVRLEAKLRALRRLEGDSYRERIVHAKD